MTMGTSWPRALGAAALCAAAFTATFLLQPPRTEAVLEPLASGPATQAVEGLPPGADAKDAPAASADLQPEGEGSLFPDELPAAEDADTAAESRALLSLLDEEARYD